ncbi:MAG TPA: hypothetical protein VG738_14585 [Chitinophagaceae bacterium]|nr:hypothetical protein [Chitinophagaceae bacterium]
MDKKELRAQVQAKIEAALAEFAKGVSEKKFKKYIKKAAKIVADGLSVPSAKKAATPKKAKAAPKKAAPKKAAAKTAKKTTGQAKTK